VSLEIAFPVQQRLLWGWLELFHHLDHLQQADAVELEESRYDLTTPSLEFPFLELNIADVQEEAPSSNYLAKIPFYVQCLWLTLSRLSKYETVRLDAMHCKFSFVV
jgi:hypothetical protein